MKSGVKEMYVLLMLEASTPDVLMVLRSEFNNLRAKTVGEMNIPSPPDNSKISSSSVEFLNCCIVSSVALRVVMSTASEKVRRSVPSLRSKS